MQARRFRRVLVLDSPWPFSNSRGWGWAPEALGGAFGALYPTMALKLAVILHRMWTDGMSQHFRE